MCVYVSRTGFPSSRAIKDVYLEIYLFLYHVFMPLNLFHFASRRFSPPLVHLEEMIPTSQYLYIISKCSSFRALYLTSLKNKLKHEGVGFALSRENQEILLCLERSLVADIPRKGGFPLH